MIPPPRKRTDSCCSTDRTILTYTGAIPFNARQVIPGTEVFRICCIDTGKVYFEGRPDKSGLILWYRLAGGEAGVRGQWNRFTGAWEIVFNKGVSGDNEEILLTYEWQPHYLNGAEVMVRLNNEDRMVRNPHGCAHYPVEVSFNYYDETSGWATLRTTVGDKVDLSPQEQAALIRLLISRFPLDGLAGV